ncbi:hypothetical protein M0R72_13395 [Candidatus Pacearchaeota archaeon]|jgi:hypothetical protein|nr:hypothetical protein [Candidatus Pacearchaeota archaeon]
MNSIMLGNLSIADMERRLGISFPEPFRADMEMRREMNASDTPAGKWHCFDMPFLVCCGDKETAEYVRDNLAPLSGQMTGQLQISWRRA